MNGLSRSTGSALAIGGAVVALVGNLLAPRFSQDDNVDVYRAVADSGRLVPADIILIAAFLLATAGIVAIASTMRGAAGNDPALLGAAAAMIGGAIALVQTGVDLYAYRELARNFVRANPDNRVGAFHSTLAVDHVNTALLAMGSILFLGLAPILISLAMMQSRAFPSWLAGIGAVGGVCCLAVGIHNLVTDQGNLDALFLVGSLLVTAWLLAGGVLMRRPAAVSAPAPATVA